MDHKLQALKKRVLSGDPEATIPYAMELIRSGVAYEILQKGSLQDRVHIIEILNTLSRNNAGSHQEILRIFNSVILNHNHMEFQDRVEQSILANLCISGLSLIGPSSVELLREIINNNYNNNDQFSKQRTIKALQTLTMLLAKYHTVLWYDQILNIYDTALNSNIDHVYLTAATSLSELINIEISPAHVRALNHNNFRIVTILLNSIAASDLDTIDQVLDHEEIDTEVKNYLLNLLP